LKEAGKNPPIRKHDAAGKKPRKVSEIRPANSTSYKQYEKVNFKDLTDDTSNYITTGGQLPMNMLKCDPGMLHNKFLFFIL
jgi:hypothetical protein